MTFVTVFKQDFKEFERLPLEVVELLQSQGVVRSAWKPNKKGKLKPVLISLDVMSKIRDSSAQMGPRVTERAVIDNCPHHRAIVECWFRYGHCF